MQYIVIDLVYHNREALMGSKTIFQMYSLYMVYGSPTRAPTYPTAHANVWNCIFDHKFPGNRFEFGIILNHFWSSTVWLRFKSYSMSSGISKILELNVFMGHNENLYCMKLPLEYSWPYSYEVNGPWKYYSP